MDGIHRQRWAAAVTVAVALATSAVLIGLTTAHKTSIEHDEGITFLAAAGTQALYQAAEQPGSGYAGEWVDAAAWRELIERPRPFALGTIRHDLAHIDIHPPAYFWLLHLWSLVFGLSPASSIALGVVIAVATGIALFVLAMRVCGDALRASGVVVFWALAPPVIGVSIVARQYGLLALLGVLAALAAHTIVTQPRPGLRAGAFLALTAALGIATHYHFAVMLAGILVWMAAASVMLRDPRPILVGGGAAGAGALLFVTMHPGFRVAFDTQQAQAQALNAHGFLMRIERTITSIAAYFVPRRLTEWTLGEIESVRWRVRGLIAIGAAVAGALLAALRRPRAAEPSGHEPAADEAGPIVGHPRPSRRKELAMLFLGVWMTGAIVYLYLTGQSPTHAMGPRYLAAAWPFLAFLPAVLLRRLDARAATVVVIAWALVVFAPMHVDHLTEPRPTATMRETVRGAERIVVDSVRRGVLPRIVVETAPATRVFAASQPVLLERTAEWVEVLEPGDIVASDPMYAARVENKEIIESLLLERYTVETLDGPAPLTWWRITGPAE